MIGLPECETAYFGEAWPAAICVECPQIPVPTQKTCAYCQEAFCLVDRGSRNGSGQYFHRECLFRMVVGSVGHLRGLCHCYGGTQEDPYGMTRREAANSAWDEFERQRTQTKHHG